MATPVVITAAEPPPFVADARQYATFLLDGLLFGVDVLQVQEVIRYQQMTRVPRAPTVVEGLINLRGQIVTAIDMRKRLGFPPRLPDQRPMNVVVQNSEGVVSLLVDGIGDVVEVEPAQFEAVPETVSPRVREVVAGVFKLKDGLMLVLEPAKAVNADVDRESAE
jgi:purine-binding chemotaxis protein CheW